ncbi:MAG: hypothetical protein ACOYYU_08350 [Chloroflexota bacterium]
MTSPWPLLRGGFARSYCKASSQAAQACYNDVYRGHSRQSAWNPLLYV